MKKKVNEIEIIPPNWNPSKDFERGKNARQNIINCLKVNRYITAMSLFDLLRYNSYQTFTFVLQDLVREGIVARKLAKNPKTKRPVYLYYINSLQEMSGTGGSAGFTPGTGEQHASKYGFAAPVNRRKFNTFGKNKKRKKNPYKLSSIMEEIFKK